MASDVKSKCVPKYIVPWSKNINENSSLLKIIFWFQKLSPKTENKGKWKLYIFPLCSKNFFEEKCLLGILESILTKMHPVLQWFVRSMMDTISSLRWIIKDLCNVNTLMIYAVKMWVAFALKKYQLRKVVWGTVDIALDVGLLEMLLMTVLDVWSLS